MNELLDNDRSRAKKNCGRTALDDPGESRAPFRAPDRTARQQSSSRFVALPFLALTFAILETALVFFAGQTLEAAAAESGRLIMTGQAQTQHFDKAAFKTGGLR